MLNIKDCGFANPRTFKDVLDYDKHSDKYKTDDLVIKDDQKFNVCLIDNSEKFENNIKQYHKDLYFANSQNRIKARHKTNAQIEKDFYSTAIMRTFRIQVNSIELNKINQGILDPAKIRQNTTTFYRKTLEQAIDILNHENDEKRQSLMVVKADVHFDQTNPHIHIHLSNLYEKKVKENRYDKERKKTVITSNNHQTDLINRLDSVSKKYEKQRNLKISPNEIFTRLLSKNNSYKFNYLNKVDLKALYPKFFNLYENNTWKKLNVDFKNLSKEQAKKEVAQIKGKWWKQDKQKYFQKIQTFLYAMDFVSDDQKNKIIKARKFNELVIYSYKLQMYLNLQKLNITDENKLRSLMNNEELFKLVALQKDKVIQPSQILFEIPKNILNLSRFDSRLKNIESHLQNLKQNELIQYFQKEYEEALQKTKEIQNHNLLFNLDLKIQDDYLKQSIPFLNLEQELAFDYGMDLIIKNHDLNYKLDPQKPTLINFQNLQIEINQLDNDIKKQIHQDLIQNLQIAKKVESNEKSLQFAKLEKSYLNTKTWNNNTKTFNYNNYENSLKEQQILETELSQTVDKWLDYESKLTDEQKEALDLEMTSLKEQIQEKQQEVKDYQINFAYEINNHLDLEFSQDENLHLSHHNQASNSFEKQIDDLFIKTRSSNEQENDYQNYVKKLSHLRSIEQHYLEEVMKRKKEALQENYLSQEHYKTKSK